MWLVLKLMQYDPFGFCSRQKHIYCSVCHWRSPRSCPGSWRAPTAAQTTAWIIKNISVTFYGTSYFSKHKEKKEIKHFFFEQNKYNAMKNLQNNNYILFKFWSIEYLLYCLSAHLNLKIILCKIMFKIIQYYLMRIQWMEKNEKKEISFLMQINR